MNCIKDEGNYRVPENSTPGSDFDLDAQKSETALFAEIAKEMTELYAKKNADYGNAFGETLSKAGIGYAVGTILVKANRFATISKNPNVNFESAEDTLMDLANYAIMTLIEIRKRNGTQAK